MEYHSGPLEGGGEGRRCRTGQTSKLVAMVEAARGWYEHSYAALGHLTGGGSSQRVCLGSALWCDFPTLNGWRLAGVGLFCGGERARTGWRKPESPTFPPDLGTKPTDHTPAVE